MPIRMDFSFDDKSKFDDFIRYIENLQFVQAEAEAMQVAEDTLKEMKDTINASRKRPDAGTHKLENALGKPEELKNDPGKELIIGIGNIDKLNTEAKYWKVLDRGGYTPPANRGYFEGSEPPIAGESGGKWTHTIGGKGKVGDFFLKPKKAIEAIDYIGKALISLEKKVNDFVIKAGGRILDGLGR